MYLLVTMSQINGEAQCNWANVDGEVLASACLHNLQKQTFFKSDYIHQHCGTTLLVPNKPTRLVQVVASACSIHQLQKQS